MIKKRSIVLVICLALFAVFCFAGTADAAGGCKDRDNDGYFNKANCGTAVDCNDNDAAVNPGAVEECTDGIDNDCDGLVDIQDPDAVNCPVCLNDNDGDGFYTDGGSCGPIDCNDNDSTIHPGSVEVCDDAATLDEDCDGSANGNDPDCASFDCSQFSKSRQCRNNSECMWQDGMCIPMVVVCTDNDGDEYSVEGGSCGAVDCNDSSAVSYPGAPEQCDGLDNNCDDVVPVDETDFDSDGYLVCDIPPDCDPFDPTVYPGALEICNGKDNDCDSIIDPEICDPTCVDNDGDGYGTNNDPTCPNGAENDCDDTNQSVYPGATEGPFGDPTCTDTLDNDCDGLIDTAQDPDCASFDCSQFSKSKQCRNNPECMWQDGMCIPVAVCTDNDGDGYNVEGGSCGAVDCNDTDPAINPGASDASCNGVDENCDGTTDNGYVPTATSCGVGECGASGQLALERVRCSIDSNRRC